MTLKFLRASGLCLTVLILGTALVTAGAPATTGGHFTAGAAHTALQGAAEDANAITFLSWGVGCKEAKYLATTSAQTTESLTVTPEYENCQERFEGEEEHGIEVITNGCQFLFTIGKKAEADNTAHLTCPPGKMIEFHLINADLRLPPQTFSGISYKATTEFGANALTVTFTATGLAAYCEAGIYCAFFGTNWLAQMTGSMKMRGTTTEGTPVGITATGSEG
jgi:hypothetical protein